jgi:hypothetical protein
MPKKLTIEEVKARTKDIGTWEVLDDVYINSKIKLNCKCIKKGHLHGITWERIKRNACCSVCCHDSMRLTIEEVKQRAKELGKWIILDNVYRTNHKKLKCQCVKCGYEHKVSWSNIRANKGCPKCNNSVLEIEFIRAEFAKEGYILLTRVYKNAKQKLDYICPRGHKHSVTWSNWNSKRKCRCPFCNDSQVSKWEKTIRKFIDKLSINYIPNDRTQLTNPRTGYNLELDMWFPDLNKAIECNGVYWHKKKKQNDKIKKQLCKDQNIDLLVITDKEWDDDIDKCKTKIKKFVMGE